VRSAVNSTGVSTGIDTAPSGLKRFSRVSAFLSTTGVAGAGTGLSITGDGVVVGALVEVVLDADVVSITSVVVLAGGVLSGAISVVVLNTDGGLSTVSVALLTAGEVSIGTPAATTLVSKRASCEGNLRNESGEAKSEKPRTDPIVVVERMGSNSPDSEE